MFDRRRYRVQASLQDNHHIHVMVSERDISVYGEQWAVGHAAWLHMMENKKDQWGNITEESSETGRILRKLCELVGSSEPVKAQFVSTIVFKPEPLEDGDEEEI